MNLTVDNTKINNNSLLKIGLQFKQIGQDECIVSVEGNEKIIASTEGTVQNNEITILKNVSFITFYVSSLKAVNVQYFKNKELIEYENETIDSEIPEKSEAHIPIIFTGGDRKKFFSSRINQRLINDWSVVLFLNSDFIIMELIGSPKTSMVCFGEHQSEITHNDFVFKLDHWTKKLYIPIEALSKFVGKEIALSVLVKPDFQKKLSNIYYKSIVSNIIEIPQVKNNVTIVDFCDPIGNELDPFYWYIDIDTNLPKYVGEN